MARIIEHQNQFLISQGESAILLLGIKDSKTKKATSIEGATVYFTLKENIDDSYPLIYKISTDISQISLTKPREGVCEIYIGSDDTVNLSAGFYLFDIWVLLSNGQRKPVVREGHMEVLKSVTRFNINV